MTRLYMYNLQAHPKAGVAWMMEWENRVSGHTAYGSWDYNLTALWWIDFFVCLFLVRFHSNPHYPRVLRCVWWWSASRRFQICYFTYRNEPISVIHGNRCSRRYRPVVTSCILFESLSVFCLFLTVAWRNCFCHNPKEAESFLSTKTLKCMRLQPFKRY